MADDAGRGTGDGDGFGEGWTGVPLDHDATGGATPADASVRVEDEAAGAEPTELGAGGSFGCAGAGAEAATGRGDDGRVAVHAPQPTNARPIASAAGPHALEERTG